MRRPCLLHLYLLRLGLSAALEPTCDEEAVMGKDSCEERNDADTGGQVWLIQFAHELQESNSSARNSAPWEDAGPPAVHNVAARVAQEPRSREHIASKLHHRLSYFAAVSGVGALSALAIGVKTTTTATVSLMWIIIFAAMVCLLAVFFLLAPWNDEKEDDRRNRRGRDDRRPVPQPESVGSAGTLLQQTRSGSQSPERERDTLPPGPAPRQGGLSVPNTPVTLRSPPPERYEPPPILCRTLTLTNLEACFLLDLDAVTSTSVGVRNIEVLSISREKLLIAKLTVGGGGSPVAGSGDVCTTSSDAGSKSLSLSSPGAEDDPIVYFANDPRAGSVFKVFGRGGQLFGTFEVDNVAGTLIVDRKPVMRLIPRNPEGTELTVNAASGQRLAEAGLAAAEQSRIVGLRRAWRVRVDPGVDAVLVCSCALALAALGH